VVSIGIYSTSRQWTTITGGGETTFSKWQALDAGLRVIGRGASRLQYLHLMVAGGHDPVPVRGLDGDYVCGLLSTPTSASISAARPQPSRSIGGHRQYGLRHLVQTSGSPDLTVSSAGLVATSGALAKGFVRATGTTSDTNGHNGNL